MNYPVDLSLFDHTAHTPSLFQLERSMGGVYGKLRDYCIPVNSYFPPPALVQRIQEEIVQTLRYYPSSNHDISEKVAETFGLPSSSVVMFNGATELLTWVDQIMLEGSVVVPIPTFGQWTDRPKFSGKRLVLLQRRAENGFALDNHELLAAVRASSATAVVLCNPNNPTGACLSRSEMLETLDLLAEVPLVIVDESFIDFTDDVPSVAADVVDRPNVLVVKSLGKNLGLHGMRLGYSVSHPELAGRLRQHVPAWNINAVAEFLVDVLRDYWPDYLASRRRCVADRRVLEACLARLPDVTVYPSQANFVYCRLPRHIDGHRLRNLLLTEFGFLVRHCGNKIGADQQHYRIVARPRSDSEELVAAMKQLLPSTMTTSHAPTLDAGQGSPQSVNSY